MGPMLGLIQRMRRRHCNSDLFLRMIPWDFASMTLRSHAILQAVIAICLLALLATPLVGTHIDAVKADLSGLANTSWPMFGHDPQHTGRSPYNGPENPQVKWQFTTGSQIIRPPAIGSDGTIYVGSNDNKLYAVNPDGFQKWSFATGGEIISSPAIATDGTIYFGSFDHRLYAVNPDGSQKWSFDTGGEIFFSPAVAADGTIYIGGRAPKLYAINPNGSQKWVFQSRYSIDSPPAIGADGTIYFGSGFLLYAVEPNGTLRWSFDSGKTVKQCPVIAVDGTVYVSFYDDRDRLCAINPDGSKRWTARASRDSQPAIAGDGTIYIGAVGFLVKELYAINPDGSRKWRLKMDGSLASSSPIIAGDGTIYVNIDESLYAISEASPVADFVATPNEGVAPLNVEFTYKSTDITSWAWDFDYDGIVDSTEQNPSHIYTTPSDYTVSLTVTGPGGSNTKTKTGYINVVSFESALAQIRADVSDYRWLFFLEEVPSNFMTEEEYRERVIANLADDIDEINATQELWVFLDLMEQGQYLYDI
ncbi:PQQ-binding-like beta-propeller repeat protein, partial [Chloroflexota bacterium]